MLKPLGHRVLVQPDPVTPKGSDLILIPDTFSVKLDEDGVETAQVTINPPYTSGIVRAVGTGPERDHRIRQQAILDCVKAVEAGGKHFGPSRSIVDIIREDLAHLIGTDPEPYIHVGDRVAFTPHYVELMQGGELLLLVDDTALIVIEEVAA